MCPFLPRCHPAQNQRRIGRVSIGPTAPRLAAAPGSDARPTQRGSRRQSSPRRGAGSGAGTSDGYLGREALTELRQLRSSKAEQLARLESAYESLLTPGPLGAANIELLRQEIVQIGELISKCEADLGSLTAEESATVKAWLHTKDRFLAVIPVAAVLAGRQHVDQPTVDSILLTRGAG